MIVTHLTERVVINRVVSSGGEKRKKYPACRTHAWCLQRACARANHGAKKAKKKKTNEAASEYVYGVKNPGRVANIYKIKVVKK